MSILKWVNGKNDDRKFITEVIDYITTPCKTDNGKLIGASGCFAEHAVNDMVTTKKIYHKTHGKQGEHFVLSLTPDTSQKSDSDYLNIAKKISSYYSEQYQCIYAVHTDSSYRHIHIVLNSVSYSTGKKFSQSPSELNKFKTHCNNILHDNCFDIINTKCQDIFDTIPYETETGMDFLEINENLSVKKDCEIENNHFVEPDEEPEPPVYMPPTNGSKSAIAVYYPKNLNTEKSIHTKEEFSKPVYVDEEDYEYCPAYQDYCTYNSYNNNAYYERNNTMMNNPYMTYAQGNTIVDTYNCNNSNPVTTLTDGQNNSYCSDTHEIIPCASVNENNTEVKQTAVLNPIPAFTHIPKFHINNSTTINITVDSDVEPDLLNKYIDNCIPSYEDKINNTKLGMSATDKFESRGLVRNIEVDNSIKFNINICDKKESSENN